MCSYNAVNGVPTCLDGHAQNTVLRGQFGFDGMIVSDCGALEDAWLNHNDVSALPLFILLLAFACKWPKMLFALVWSCNK
jgi:hypothetical protein